jgi:hypothetical protein
MVYYIVDELINRKIKYSHLFNRLNKNKLKNA